MTQDALFEVPEEMWVYKRCRVCGGALSIHHTHTYIVQRQWWVKIGATSNARRRINELSRPAWKQHILYPPEMNWEEPLEKIAVYEGNFEHEWHILFQRCHVLGEWFDPDTDMQDWLDGIRVTQIVSEASARKANFAGTPSHPSKARKAK